MRKTITMSTVEQRRAWVLTKVLAGEVDAAQAAVLLGLSIRSIWRLKGRFAEEDRPGSSIASAGGPRRAGFDEAVRERVRSLARGRYDGANDSHLAELLAEVEGISLS